MRLTPPVLSLLVPLLESLLDGLLGLLPLGRLLEGLRGNGTLERLELEHVSGGEEVGVVDDLDERLNLGSTSNSLLAHVLGHLEGVPVIPNLVVGMAGGGEWVKHTSQCQQQRRGGKVAPWSRRLAA